MEEVWKDIVGYEGLYQVSNLGRVKSLNCGGKIMGVTVLPKGYLKIGLTKNKIRKYYFIHRLVAEAFIDNPNNLPCVNHKDCNTSNNCINNLEWITHKDNNNYIGRNIKAKLTSVIYYLKKDYPNEIEMINKLQEIKSTIQKL